MKAWFNFVYIFQHGRETSFLMVHSFWLLPVYPTRLAESSLAPRLNFLARLGTSPVYSETQGKWLNNLDGKLQHKGWITTMRSHCCPSNWEQLYKCQVVTHNPSPMAAASSTGSLAAETLEIVKQVQTLSRQDQSWWGLISPSSWSTSLTQNGEPWVTGTRTRFKHQIKVYH